MSERTGAGRKNGKVGKRIGNCIYLHRFAALHGLPTKGAEVLTVLQSAGCVRDDWDYVKYDSKTAAITFAWCKDWDTAHEPIILRQERWMDGQCEVIDYANCLNPFIIHGKHLFVAADYQGFDYAEAQRRFESYQRASWIDRSRMGRLQWWDEHKHEGGLD